jgi:hypothetical protein
MASIKNIQSRVSTARKTVAPTTRKAVTTKAFPALNPTPKDVKNAKALGKDQSIINRSKQVK